VLFTPRERSKDMQAAIQKRLIRISSQQSIADANLTAARELILWSSY
jgi:hypothetical protein